MSNSRKSIIFLVVALALIAVGVGYLMSTSGGNTEEALRQQVQKEWEARSSGDWGTVYDITTRGFKEKIAKANFMSKANVVVREFSVKEVRVLESGKEGQTLVEYKMSQMGFDFNTKAKGKWLWEDGAWHLDLPAALSPF